jgi:DNA repair protein RecO (recombination protein O)
MMELLNKCLKHPEKNPELFEFCARALVNLDRAAQKDIPDIMLRFALRLPQFLGYGIIPPAEMDWGNKNPDDDFHLDLHEGSFSYSLPEHPYCLSGREAKKAALLLDDSGFSMTGPKVNYSVILEKISEFYTLHNPEFGKMRTLSFLQEMIS